MSQQESEIKSSDVQQIQVSQEEPMKESKKEEAKVSSYLLWIPVKLSNL
jgi:hypothetical protein